VDVEPVSERALRGMGLYLNDTEQGLVFDGPWEPAEAATRLWTIKEAAAKALDLPLPRAWKQVHVDQMGEHESRARVGHAIYTARHETIEGHVFTLWS
jgi:hypothetical protein